jgi:hypothetical protein
MRDRKYGTISSTLNTFVLSTYFYYGKKSINVTMELFGNLNNNLSINLFKKKERKEGRKEGWMDER